MAVSPKTFSMRLENRLSNSPVGNIFTDLLAFIKELLPLIQTLPCLMAAKRNAKKLKAAVDDEFRSGVKKKRGRCPRKVRKLMEQYGPGNVDDQDEAWHLICAEAFADSTNVADALAS